ncbi:hypothetical protein [Brevibacterium ammoniilyticum]
MARAGRVGLVREALGIAAYHVEKYDEAVRELRTHRRISGSNENIALIADAERGRGKPEKALELLEWAKEAELDNDTRTELVIVAAGAKSDLGDIDAARALIEAEDFTQRPSGALVRLMSAYAEVLRLHGETELADKYEELSRRTAKATGTLFGDEEPDPNFGVEIETIEEIPDEDLQGGDDADADSNGDSDSNTDADADVEADAHADADADEDVAADDFASNGTASNGTVSDETPSTDESALNADAGQTGSTDDEAPTSTGEEASAESAADDSAPAAEADAPTSTAPSSKTHVSEKELKKVKVSDDEIEAELDELLAEADAADSAETQIASDATDGDANADAVEAPNAGDEADATPADDTATDADDTATDEPEGSDSANGDR